VIVLGGEREYAVREPIGVRRIMKTGEYGP
jgi:hypothetical protein